MLPVDGIVFGDPHRQKSPEPCFLSTSLRGWQRRSRLRADVVGPRFRVCMSASRCRSPYSRLVWWAKPAPHAAERRKKTFGRTVAQAAPLMPPCPRRKLAEAELLASANDLDGCHCAHAHCRRFRTPNTRNASVPTTSIVSMNFALPMTVPRSTSTTILAFKCSKLAA